MGFYRKTWKIREDYRPLLERALELFPTTLGHVVGERIFLCSFYCRKSQHLAKIRSVYVPWSLLIHDYDYAVEFWASQFDEQSEAHRLYIMVHELSHIHEYGHTDTKFRGKLLHHDIEDFTHLRLMYGVQLGHVKDILKGEKVLFKDKIRKYPRLARVG